MTAFDPRITPARPDLAARHLEGVVAAARFVDGRPYDVVEPQAPVRRARAQFRVNFLEAGGPHVWATASTAGNPTVAVARRGTYHQLDVVVARL